MLKLLDLYLLKRFTSRILFLIVALSAVILITNLVEMIDNFVDANMSSNEIFNYYILTLPMIISYAIPMSITLSTVLSLVAYIKNNELLALRALGINYFRLSSSIIITSIFISFFHFYFENSIVSNSTRLKNSHKHSKCFCNFIAKRYLSFVFLPLHMLLWHLVAKESNNAEMFEEIDNHLLQCKISVSSLQ